MWIEGVWGSNSLGRFCIVGELVSWLAGCSVSGLEEVSPRKVGFKKRMLEINVLIAPQTSCGLSPSCLLQGSAQ